MIRDGSIVAFGVRLSCLVRAERRVFNDAHPGSDVAVHPAVVLNVIRPVRGKGVALTLAIVCVVVSVGMTWGKEA